MRSARAIGLATVLLLASVVAGAGGVDGATGTSVNQPTGPFMTSAQPEDGAAGENVSLGGHVTTYLQSSAARTAGAAETGLWIAAYEAAPNETRRALIARGADRIEHRVQALESRKRALEAARENGSIGPVAYRAELSRIAGRLAALSSAITAVGARADEAGVATDRLAALRQRARGLADEDVRDVARGLAGADGQQGRPAWLESLDRGPSNASGSPPERAAAGNGSSETGNGAPDGRGAGADGRRRAILGDYDRLQSSVLGRPSLFGG